MHGGFRRGARLAQATGRVMGTLKCVWACFCIRSSYLRSLYRVFDDHSIPSDMPPESRASSGAHAPPRPGIRLVDVAIPGSPAAHAMQLPCLQTGGQPFEIMCEPGRADRRRCRLPERVSWRTRFVRSGPRASGKNASCTGCSRAGAINSLRSLAASIRRHATPDSLSQSGSSADTGTLGGRAHPCLDGTYSAPA